MNIAMLTTKLGDAENPPNSLWLDYLRVNIFHIYLFKIATRPPWLHTFGKLST